MNKQKFPHIGLRIVKTAIAVFLVLMVFYFLPWTRTPFYAAIAAVLCTQPMIENTKTAARNRVFGTFIGAFWGAVYILIEFNFLKNSSQLVFYCLVSIGILLVLYTTVLLKNTAASFFTCVVFLSITIITRGDTGTFEFVFYRVLDTIIGIGIAFFITWFHLPVHRRKDILFISGVDDTLVSINDQMSSYSKVDLNRLLSDGLNFTIATQRTPASLVELTGDINLNLPVIAMDGAVLYDIRENRYLLKYVINSHRVKLLKEYFEGHGISYFANVILDDVLLIYTTPFTSSGQREFYEMYRKSPYRNYIHEPVPDDREVVYFLIMDTEENIYHIIDDLRQNKIAERVRFKLENSGIDNCILMKIYSANASRRNMIDYLLEQTGLKQTMTFGSIEGKYDVVVQAGDMNQVVKTIRHNFEPLIWRKMK